MNIEDMTINEREEYIKTKIPEDVYNGLFNDWDNFYETCFSTVYNLIEDNFDEDGLDENGNEIHDVIQDYFDIFLLRIPTQKIFQELESN